MSEPVNTTNKPEANLEAQPQNAYEVEVQQHLESERMWLASKPIWYRFIVNSWTQIVLVSLICFCLPGLYNAISGMGGSGQLDPTVSPVAGVGPVPNHELTTVPGRSQLDCRTALGRSRTHHLCRSAHL